MSSVNHFENVFIRFCFGTLIMYLVTPVGAVAIGRALESVTFDRSKFRIDLWPNVNEIHPATWIIDSGWQDKFHSKFGNEEQLLFLGYFWLWPCTAFAVFAKVCLVLALPITMLLHKKRGWKDLLRFLRSFKGEDSKILKSLVDLESGEYDCGYSEKRDYIGAYKIDTGFQNLNHSQYDLDNIVISSVSEVNPLPQCTITKELQHVQGCPVFTSSHRYIVDEVIEMKSANKSIETYTTYQRHPHTFNFNTKKCDTWEIPDLVGYP